MSILSLTIVLHVQRETTGIRVLVTTTPYSWQCNSLRGNKQVMVIVIVVLQCNGNVMHYFTM
jgi:hypothetical protein